MDGCRIGCIHNQLQRHAFQAYQPMVLKWSSLHDVLVLGAPVALSAEEINAPPSKDDDYISTLMQMAADAEKVLDDDFERPLYFRSAS